MALKQGEIASVRVRVPATIANLGAGFDNVGMAVDLWNTLTVRRGDFAIAIRGAGADALPKDTTNLLVTGVRTAFKHLGLDEADMPALAYEVEQEIPIGSGLGSSSAAIVGGLMAGAAMVGRDLTPTQVVQLAADIEGHSDNIAPAVFGGCVIGVKTDESWHIETVRVPDKLTFVLFCPDGEVNTNASRASLPDKVALSDAVHNIGRAMLLVNAFNTGNLETLKIATEDRLHQPFRAGGIKGMQAIIRAAMNGGALGAFLAGSGPTIAALAVEKQMTISYEMQEAARQAGVTGRSMVFECPKRGAHVVSRDE